MFVEVCLIYGYRTTASVPHESKTVRAQNCYSEQIYKRFHFIMD